MKAVYLGGVFDLFHYGHIELITLVRRKFPGYKFIIGVYNDWNTIVAYQRCPVMTMQERVRNIQSSGLVDEVISNAPIRETETFYRAHEIDVTVHVYHTKDRISYTSKFCPDAGSRLAHLDYTSPISSTQLISRILQRERSSANDKKD